VKAPPKPFVILADTREQLIPPFPDGVVVERATLETADYTTPVLRTIAVIERKSPGDFASTLSWGRQRFDREVERLQGFVWKAVVVEGELSEVFRSSATHPHAIIGSIASLFARHDTPVLFVGNPAGAGRLISGLLRRWEERVAVERGLA
jgi:DNA excision repair protein ERCC-4